MRPMLKHMLLLLVKLKHTDTDPKGSEFGMGMRTEKLSIVTL
jgi:hypothetical protein